MFFRDIRSKLPAPAREALEQLRPPTSIARVAENRGRLSQYYEAMNSYLARRLAICYPEAAAAPCAKHSGLCPVAPQRSELPDGRWTANISGIMCTPWSSYGARLELADPMTEVYYVWLNERLARQEDFIGIENSPHFDSRWHEKKMGTTDQTVKLILGPEMLGWPVARDRLTLFSWKHSEWVWVGPDLATVASDFRTLFQRKAAGHAAALSTAQLQWTVGGSCHC